MGMDCDAYVKESETLNVWESASSYNMGTVIFSVTVSAYWEICSCVPVMGTERSSPSSGHGSFPEQGRGEGPPPPLRPDLYHHGQEQPL